MLMFTNETFCQPHRRRRRPTNIRFSVLPYSSSLRNHLRDVIITDTLTRRTRDGQKQHDGREELLRLRLANC
jgi:hypothetical protein